MGSKNPEPCPLCSPNRRRRLAKGRAKVAGPLLGPPPDHRRVAIGLVNFNRAIVQMAQVKDEPQDADHHGYEAHAKSDLAQA